MGFRFAISIPMYFKPGGDLAEHFQAAATLGFTGAEVHSPYTLGENDVASLARSFGIQTVLINTESGGALEHGYASLPCHTDHFHATLEKSITYAKALDCKRIHLLSGMRSPQWSIEAIEENYESNLRYAACRLKEENIVGLIEAINPNIVPNYFMDDPFKALGIVRKLNHPNIRLQLDVYHLQMLAGGLTQNIREMLPYTEYIQVAQAPNRNEPSSPGEINFRYVFDLLQELKYEGWIGLEYKPSGSLVESMRWIKDWNLTS